MNENDWIFYTGLPPEDGKYLCRMDEYEEINEVDVVNRKAYKNGEEWIIINHEWKNK